MVREYAGPINSFADAFRARRHLWVLCQGCGHTALMDPRSLIAKLGEISFERAAGKLRCARCGRARVSFVPKDEPWSSMR
jgi:ribosomal protein S27E